MTSPAIEQSSPCYLTLTLRRASHNPTDMFSLSYRLSWWNICSVVNGVIVASRSRGQIAVKFIDLFFEWHDSSFSFKSCNSMTVSAVSKSIKVVIIYAFIPSFHLGLFFPKRNSHVGHHDWSFSSLCEPFSVGPLHHDPYNSLHEPLTAENKTLCLTWKETRGKKSTFVAR